MKLSEALQMLNESAWNDITNAVSKIIKSSNRQKESTVSLSMPKVSSPKRYVSDNMYLQKNDYFMFGGKQDEYVIEYSIDKDTMKLEMVQVRYTTIEKESTIVFDDIVKQIDKMLGSKYQKRQSEWRGIRDVQWFLKNGVLLKGGR